jgi:uncharacterized repeat protein (TIGR03803 family)
MKQSHGNWVLNPLYAFQGSTDGKEPLAGVVVGPNGILYGTTVNGGSQDQGTVFDMRPAVQACKSTLCPWNESVLYRFQGGSDGAGPNYGNLLFDNGGNIYGVTIVGGSSSQGTVYKLARSSGGWTERVIHTFSGPDGAQPFAGVIFDNKGNLYGTAQLGGDKGFGTVYELSPVGQSWGENTLYQFQGGNDGQGPVGTLTFDISGNLYGTTCAGGSGGGGTIYELSPSGGGWTFATLYSFGGTDCPWAGLTMDNAGNLYGVTVDGGNQGACLRGCGTIFKLSPANGGWRYAELYEFSGSSDGQNPYSQMLMDGSGNLYGTCSAGGSNGLGVVWEITP